MGSRDHSYDCDVCGFSRGGLARHEVYPEIELGTSAQLRTRGKFVWIPGCRRPAPSNALKGEEGREG